jgi:hypothetical protein
MVDARSSTDHKSELIAKAQTFLEELRAAAAAARERIFAGAARKDTPQTEHVDAPVPAPVDADPIFATREFDVPPKALAALIDFTTVGD